MEKEYVMRLKVEGGKVVSADLGELGKSGEQAFKKIKNSTDLTDLAFANLKRSIVGNLLPYLGAGALLSGINSVVTGLADLNDVAERTKGTVTRLQELRYAAVAIGESASLMDAAILDFSQKLGAAQNGMGKLLPVLKDYNIELKDAAGNNRSVEAVMNDYVDAIANTATQQERLFLASKAFGEDAGVKLIEVFQQGSEGLKRYAIEAHALGLVIDSDLIKKADEFDTYLKQLGYTVETNFKSVTISALTEIEERFDRIKNAIQEAIDLLEDFTAAQDANRIEAFGVSIVDPTSYGKVLDDFKNNREARARNKGWDSVGGWNIDPNDPDPLGLNKGNAGASGGSPKFDPDARKNAAAAERDAQALARVIENLKFKNEQMHRSNEEQELYNQLRAAGVELDSAAGREIQKLIIENREFNRELERQKTITENLDKAYNGFLERVVDNLEDGKITWEEFGQAAAEALKQILMARDSAGNYIGGDILKGAASDLGGFFSGIFDSLPSFDVGAWNVPRDQAAIVHEGETILPRPFAEDYRRNASGSGGVEVNIINNTPSNVQVRQAASGNRRAVEVIIQEVVAGSINSPATPINKALRKFGSQGTTGK